MSGGRPASAGAAEAAALTPGHLYRAAGLLFLLAYLLWHLPQITRVLLLLYAAAIVAVLLNAVVSRVPLPRRWAAPLVVLALAAATAITARLAVPPLTEVVPVLGPWIGGAAATAVAYLYDPGKAAWTALAALGIQQFENNVIIPWAMSRSVHLHPLVTLFAVILFGSLFGALGVLLSLPLVILVWTVVQVLWVERAVGVASQVRPVVRE